MFWDIVINGLTQGSIYALLAIGFSLIFGVAHILNLSHTAFYMLSAYLIYWGSTTMHWPFLLAVGVAVGGSMLLGLVVYRWVIHPIREHQTAIMIATLALAIALQEGIVLLFGSEQYSIPPIAEGFYEMGGTRISYQHLFTFGGVLLLFVGVWAGLTRTKLGLMIRCVAQDSEVANLMGMNVRQVALLTMGLSVLLAALAGALVAPLYVLTPNMWMHPLIMTMAIVVLGGMGSVKGSVWGAYILGFAETIVVFVLPGGSFLKGTVALTVLILMLLIRPEGLFGIAFEEER